MTGWTTSVTSTLTPDLTGTGEATQAARLSSSTARNQGTTRFQLAKFWLTSRRALEARFGWASQRFRREGCPAVAA
jgi:hypothetical protein